jgi:hypothetical protein
VDTSKKNTDKKEETVCNINGSTDGECLSCSA